MTSLGATRACALGLSCALAWGIGVAPAAAQRGRTGALRAKNVEKLARVREEAKKRNEHVGDRVAKMRYRTTESLGGKKARASRLVARDGETVILRRPRRRALQANHALQVLAGQLEAPDLIPAALLMKARRRLGSFADGEAMMVMKDAGKEFVGGDRAPFHWRDRVSEPTRVTAALLDLLTQQRDRKMANLLINEKGEVRLIDPDRTFAAKGEKPVYRSAFFPGERLAYRSKQKRLSNLPEPAQALVRFLATRTVKQLESDYGLGAKDAATLRDRAQDVRDKGLTRAIDMYLSTVTLKPSR